MKKWFTKKHQDNSGEDGYAFAFQCDICGKPHDSRRVGHAELERQEGRRLGRREAHRLALQQASRDARLHFNRCVRCHKWACDKDYDIEMGMCVHCLKRMGILKGRGNNQSGRKKYK